MAKESGGTRLDRLLKLLEGASSDSKHCHQQHTTLGLTASCAPAGGTPATRSGAAAAIGEIGAAHRAQLPALLRRVRAARGAGR